MDQIKINKNNFNWSWTWTEEKHSSQPESLSSTTKFKWMQIRDATTPITILHKPVIKCNSTNSPQTEWNSSMLIKSVRLNKTVDAWKEGLSLRPNQKVDAWKV